MITVKHCNRGPARLQNLLLEAFETKLHKALCGPDQFNADPAFSRDSGCPT